MKSGLWEKNRAYFLRDLFHEKAFRWSGLVARTSKTLTEASMNLAGDPELYGLMVQAGFKKVFVGIETPSREALAECHKVQNRNRNLVAAVQTLQKTGLELMGGFIVGFDLGAGQVASWTRGLLAALLGSPHTASTSIPPSHGAGHHRLPFPMCGAKTLRQFTTLISSSP